MATDYLGETIAAGDQYMVAGVVRAISGDTVKVVVDGDKVVTCDAADLVPVRELASWNPVFAQIGGAMATGLTLNLNGVDSQYIGIPIPFDCTLRRVSVAAWHFDSTSPPSTGTLRARKNGGFTADQATFSFNFDAAVDTTEVTEGAWSSAVAFARGDTMHLLADFTSIDSPGLYVTIHATRD